MERTPATVDAESAPATAVAGFNIPPTGPANQVLQDTREAKGVANTQPSQDPMKIQNLVDRPSTLNPLVKERIRAHIRENTKRKSLDAFSENSTGAGSSSTGGGQGLPGEPARTAGAGSNLPPTRLKSSTRSKSESEGVERTQPQDPMNIQNLVDPPNTASPYVKEKLVAHIRRQSTKRKSLDAFSGDSTNAGSSSTGGGSRDQPKRALSMGNIDCRLAGLDVEDASKSKKQ